ncbi:Multidomain esterase [Lachnellula suecica]|uniref:Multidomain esterase n=1 Tax=Lachnellula suecica TaxID=602035 RepID=A0A8T9CGW7_9HELO|nr:Multidomain esterase [Lachnellula suecica]
MYPSLTSAFFVYFTRVLRICIGDNETLVNNDAIINNGTTTNGTNLRILPLGDSITFGFNEASGNSYRRYLECMLYQAGNGVQYIGSLKNGNWSDNANDGFSGQTIDQIGITGNPEIIGTPKANVFLVHAGTNDMDQNLNITYAPFRLGTLIDEVTVSNPDALVLVAQIIVNANTTVNDWIKTYNEALPAVVGARSKNVRLVSMDKVLVGDLLDGTHPNEGGYLKMANAWYPALMSARNEGLIMLATQPFTNEGGSSLPAGGGNCSTLTS